MKPTFNRLALALCLTAAGTSAHAADTFIGYTLGQTNNNIQKNAALNNNLGSPSLDKVIHKSGTSGLRVGQQDADGRYYLTLEKVEGSSKGFNMTQRNLLASYDRFLPVGDYGTKLFGGVSAGVVKLVQNSSGFSRDSNIGYAAGVQVGALQPITDNFSIETGYRYLRTNASVDMTPHGKPKAGSLDLHSSGQAYLGVNYQF